MRNSPKFWRPDRAGVTSPVPKMMRAPRTRARQRGFLDFSFSELVITFGLALVVLGPKKLPGLVQQIGRWVGRARHMARQFREQLEQEVNSINAVKPVPRHVAPEVGPAAPETPAATENPVSTPGTEATGVVEAGSAEQGTAAPTPVEPAGNDLHPEAQMYFAMNGSEPAVVTENPHAPQPAGDDPQALTEHATASIPAGEPAPTKDAGTASVEVVFPHDHV